MANCASCGIQIPEGQPVCSMCYGDPFYGRDGIYLQWLEDIAATESAAAEEYERWLAEQQKESNDGNAAVDGR